MRLFKAHGLGNDYLVLESGQPLDAALVRALCDRHRGPGGDGILEPQAPVDGAYGLRIWNPDGSIAERSGNGLRIFARWLVETKGAPRSLTIDTGFTRSACEVGDDLISVDMGVARLGSAEPIFVGCHTLPAREVHVGNPHVVLRPAGVIPWPEVGAQVETLPRFPNRTNVQVVDSVVGSNVHIRIWERGAGETSASGSSATAVAAAGVADGWLPAGTVTVHMPGGTLQVVVDSSLAATLIGPVTAVGWFLTAPEGPDPR